jgi:hypothetical protein
MLINFNYSIYFNLNASTDKPFSLKDEWDTQAAIETKPLVSYILRSNVGAKTKRIIFRLKMAKCDIFDLFVSRKLSTTGIYGYWVGDFGVK